MSRRRKLLTPGERAPLSGQFEIVRRGRRTGVERTVVRGEPLPPTPRKRDRYRVTDRTRNKTGRTRR
ncbi:MAG TPA: hypothetical protein VKF62_08590 [Planctomycetota bacterium]|nr:hypothetical protein [Planctomycetota bacterium]